MKTKLNAEEISAKRLLTDKSISEELGFYEFAPLSTAVAATTSYALAIREVAQPLADERDEYREALEAMFVTFEALEPLHRTVICNARAILAKYPKP